MNKYECLPNLQKKKEQSAAMLWLGHNHPRTVLDHICITVFNKQKISVNKLGLLTVRAGTELTGSNTVFAPAC